MVVVAVIADVCQARAGLKCRLELRQNEPVQGRQGDRFRGFRLSGNRFRLTGDLFRPAVDLQRYREPSIAGRRGQERGDRVQLAGGKHRAEVIERELGLRPCGNVEVHEARRKSAGLLGAPGAVKVRWGDYRAPIGAVRGR